MARAAGYITLVSMLTGVAGMANAQQLVPAQDRQVVVLLDSGAVELPQGRQWIPLAAEKVRAAGLRRALTAHGAARMRLAVPNWPAFRNAFPAERVVRPRRDQLMPPDALVDMSGWVVVEYPEGVIMDRAIADLRREREVLAADRARRPSLQTPFEVRGNRSNRRNWLFLMPNDPVFVAGNNWGFFNAGNPAFDVNASAAWDIQSGSSGVRIAILDSGTDPLHPDFSGKIVAQYDFADEDGDASPNLGSSGSSPYHGTAVAGIAGARTNNGQYTAGLCGGNGANPGCSLLIARLSFDGGLLEWLGVASDGADAVTWAVANGAKAINNSWCYNRGFFGASSLPMHQAARNAAQVGVLVTAAMGNSNGQCGQNAHHESVTPAAFSDIIMAVGATDQLGRRVTYANGFNWESATGPHISVVAPSPSHWSAFPLALGGQGTFGGTSGATPMASGLAGLLFSEFQAKGFSLLGYDARRIMELTALDREAVGWDANTGHGIVDAHAALSALQPPNTLATGVAPPAPSCYATTGDPQTWSFWASFAVLIAVRCELRQAITFPIPFVTPPLVWGRPVTGGGVTPSDPNSEVYFTGVVPGTVTTSGATLRTYAYQLWSLGGSYLGWYPAQPNSIVFGYGVLGTPQPFTVTAAGPGMVSQKATYAIYGSANAAASNWLWEQSYNYGPYQFWSNAQNSQFVAYAGYYSLGWRLGATRNMDGAPDSDEFVTNVCIPYNPANCELAIRATQVASTTPAPTVGLNGTPAGTPDSTRRAGEAGVFGSGVWISRDGAGESKAIRMYSLDGDHDGWQASSAWPNSLRGNGAGTRRVNAQRGAILVTESRTALSGGATAVRVRVTGTDAAASYRMSFAVDPDLGVAPADDRLVLVDSLGLAVVIDPDAGAVAYGWAGFDGRSSVREYDNRGAPFPGRPEGAYAEQRLPSRVVGQASDVRFIVTAPSVRASFSGQVVAVFLEARGADADGAIRALLEARRNEPGAAPVATETSDTSSAAVLEVRQYLEAGPPAFGLSSRTALSVTASLSGSRSSAANAARVRAEGIMAISLNVSSPAGPAVLRISILDSRGRVVRRAFEEDVASGSYLYRWDGLSDSGERVAPGVYQALVEGVGLRRRSTLVVTR